MEGTTGRDSEIGRQSSNWKCLPKIVKRFMARIFCMKIVSNPFRPSIGVVKSISLHFVVVSRGNRNSVEVANIGSMSPYSQSVL
jgi:hypothetical protein